MSVTRRGIFAIFSHCVAHSWGQRYRTGYTFGQMQKFLFLFVLFSANSHANGGPESFACFRSNIGRACPDQCMHFPNHTVAVEQYGQRKLALYLHGKVYKVAEVKSKLIARGDDLKLSDELISRMAENKESQDAILLGDINEKTYIGNGLKIRFRTTILDTSCFWKNADGKYDSTGGECDSTSKMELFVTVNGKEKHMETEVNGYSERCE